MECALHFGLELQLKLLFFKLYLKQFTLLLNFVLRFYGRAMVYFADRLQVFYVVQFGVHFLVQRRLKVRNGTVLVNDVLDFFIKLIFVKN